MQCAALLAQLPDPHSYSSIGWVVAVLAVLGGFYLLTLRIGNERAKKIQNETGSPERRTILPTPLITEQVKIFVEEPKFREEITQLKQEIAEVEGRIDKKFEENQTVFRDRF